MLLLALAPAVAMAARHPRLVSVENTRCTTCHAEKTRGTTVHPPAAEDCTTCHEMTIAPSGTTVALAEEEPALCVGCHDDKAAAAEGELPSPHAPVTDSCLDCHDPHATDTPHLITADSVPELCTGCHDPGDLEGPHGGVLPRNARCTACHLPHGGPNPKLLRAAGQHPPFAEGSCDACHRKPLGPRMRLRGRIGRICSSCHGDLTEGSTVTHPALDRRRNRRQCVACHDPHMSDVEPLLRAEGPALCASCHPGEAKAATGDGGHAPAAEACTTCHQPHAAARRYLLDDAPPELCLGCHDADDLRAPHLGADPESLTCTDCHTPHGSDNPKLLAANLHPPLLDGCDTCHEGAYDRLEADGGSELCLACHDDIGEAAAAAKVPHPAMELARCADCHNPHASPQEHLVKEPAGGECLACHDDMGPREGETAHGVITLIGCRACHEPHGGQRPRLLRAEGDALCLACHDASHAPARGSSQPVTVLGRFEVPAHAARRMAVVELTDGKGHPVSGHRAVGPPTRQEVERAETTFTGTLGCLTCHDPHRGRYRLLRWDAESPFAACSHCHPK